MGAAPPELWAGFECTVNRVGEAYVDQLDLTGHARRPEDLELLAELGARAVRYPVLWERTAPAAPDEADWRWSDARLDRLRALEIRPIVGLLHHGSGPRYTSLLDRELGDKLAVYAGAVARRYPWVADYTPVNEPLTTARFSGLYGHWYPHGRGDREFVAALLNQCRATVLAMRAIREVQPAARLVQTDDLGKTFSTPALDYQARFDNERRWLGFDLLLGRVDRAHPLWGYLLYAGATERDLGWFLDRPSPPDVVGINHYLSSERFLDERLERYPAGSHGGNGRHRYADVLAARVCPEGPVGPRTLLREAWERYRLPLAVTEVHNACTREEQLRWLVEVWQAASDLRVEGVDLRGVTAWSLVGAVGWDRLVTAPDDRYEAGVYDARAPRPRPTALVAALRQLAAGQPADHPVLAQPGWWRRPERLSHPPVSRGPNLETASSIPRPALRVRPILITGATGTLGRATARLAAARGLAYRLLTRQELDIADPAAVSASIDRLDPWAIVNTAGYVRVDDAESDSARCWRENVAGPLALAEVCGARGVRLVTYSSDLVFDGLERRPYVESDPVGPLGVYGATKAAAENGVLERLPTALVVRTSAFFGPWDEYNFVRLALRELAAGRPFIAADDARVSPTYVPDLVDASLDLLIDGAGGLWHLANRGDVSWAELAARAARSAGLGAGSLVARPTAELGLAARRPGYSVLGSERAWLMPDLDDALERYRRGCEAV